MAVTIIQATQMTADENSVNRPYPVDRHGKLRFQYGLATQGAIAGDAGSQVEFCVLPPGRKRIITYLSRYKVSALGAARVMAVGFRAYYDRSVTGATPQAESANTFMAAIDVSAATDALWPTTAGIKYDMFSRGGITLFATVTGGTIPAAATFEFLLAYLYE